MPHQFDLVVFDLDGTLCDTAPDIGRCLNQAMEDFGLPPVPREKLLKAIGPGGTAFHRAIVPNEEALPLAEKIVDRYRSYYVKSNTVLTRPFPGIIEMLDDLRATGLTMAVASNKPQEQTRQIVRGLGLMPYFAEVVGPEAVPRPKPEPDVLHFLIERVGRGCPPGRTAMVGDTDNDMSAGRAAGVRTVFVTWGYMSESEIAPGSIDIVVSSPKELVAVLTESRQKAEAK